MISIWETGEKGYIRSLGLTHTHFYEIDNPQGPTCTGEL